MIGQLYNTYILCEAEDGLVLIDQHAAHERVLYEQLGRGGKMASQALLVPETVDLGFREAQVLETLLPALREVGLDGRALRRQHAWWSNPSRRCSPAGSCGR